MPCVDNSDEKRLVLTFVNKEKCDCREAYALHTSVKDVVYNARSFARYLGVYNDYRFVHVTVYDGVDYDGPVVFEAWS